MLFILSFWTVCRIKYLIIGQSMAANHVNKLILNTESRKLLGLKCCSDLLLVFKISLNKITNYLISLELVSGVVPCRRSSAVSIHNNRIIGYNIPVLSIINQTILFQHQMQE